MIPCPEWRSMNDEPSSLSDFDGTVRLFPLPNVVLFPQVVLPLHIFEPRYRQMTADALKGDRLLTMALLQSETDAAEMAPPIHPVVCVGKIIVDQNLEDGRFNILLRGLSRARIVRELPCEKLYRSARVELLRDRDEPAFEVGLSYRMKLEALARIWCEAMGISFDEMDKLIDSDVSTSWLSDVLTFTLPLEVAFKQKLLSELRIEKRLRWLVKYLKNHEPPKIDRPPPRPFPPPFSSN
jgi:Lon protease-like protein